jgi:transcriptional regulator with XRE-family HTH domain
MPALNRPLAGRGESTADLKLELGRYIRELREKRGMTQADLARAVGMTYYTAISAIEVGRNTLPTERYLQFSQALGVAPKTFMKRVLALKDPWAYALLFEADPTTALADLDAQLAARWSSPGIN